MAVPKTNDPLDVLQQMVNDVLVQTGKALRAANRDSKGQLAQANLAISTKIPASIETFNFALDDLESEIVRAKAVLHRDLDRLQARRRPAEPLPVAVAPPAPMVIDLSSPDEEPPAATPAQQPQAFTGAGREIKQEVKPVAPFPDMDAGFDVTASPETSHAAPPGAVSKSREVKRAPKPAADTGVATVRPAGAPPRKETKVPLPQIPRLANPSPKAPASAIPASAPAPTPVTLAASAPQLVTSTPAVSAPLPAASSNQMPALGNANPTSVGPNPEPASADTPFASAAASIEAVNQGQPQPEFDLTAFAPSDPSSGLLNLESFPGGVDGSGGLSGAGLPQGGEDVEKNIEELLDLHNVADMDLDYDLGVDNSSFNEIYFGEDMNVDGGEFDNAYFPLE